MDLKTLKVFYKGVMYFFPILGICVASAMALPSWVRLIALVQFFLTTMLYFQETGRFFLVLGEGIEKKVKPRPVRIGICMALLAFMILLVFLPEMNKVLGGVVIALGIVEITQLYVLMSFSNFVKGA